MKRTILSAALTVILAACGSGGDTQPAALEQQQPVEQVQPVTPGQQKLDPVKESEYLDPMSDRSGTTFEAPKAEEAPVGEWDIKFLNQGVARAILEYKMVGESLKTELATEMGEGVDAWIKKDAERCFADTMPNVIDEEKRAPFVRLVCTGQAYGYWALVNGTAGTEGTPRQCLEKGYCGYMFKQYDLNAPFIPSTDGLDNEL